MESLGNCEVTLRSSSQQPPVHVCAVVLAIVLIQSVSFNENDRSLIAIRSEFSDLSQEVYFIKRTTLLIRSELFPFHVLYFYSLVVGAYLQFILYCLEKLPEAEEDPEFLMNLAITGHLKIIFDMIAKFADNTGIVHDAICVSGVFEVPNHLVILSMQEGRCWPTTPGFCGRPQLSSF